MAIASVKHCWIQFDMFGTENDRSMITKLKGYSTKLKTSWIKDILTDFFFQAFS